MVDWHNFAGGAPVRNFYADGANLISFSRGDRAFIAINNEVTAQTHTFTTGLPKGTYCDIIHGTFSRDRHGSNCSGPTVTVGQHGTATMTVPAKDSVAFDAGDLVRR
jgi:alpha-amylase